MRIYQNKEKLKQILRSTDLDDLKRFWECDIDADDVVSKWSELIEENIKAAQKTNLPLHAILQL